ncbi:probable LRR receptor-like serine/threonine-protein kinase At3g47570 [Solanum dulcamara]|uniref:probable LRR receptor-like serine/threonine-protein kinase At3g47570 n=1 Tax=Solanum dulcamara TaxID=45834 RepID=UPI002485CADE|nr:probable LRR receptor-like serine/threonine-protein kinase At3g47570 [Solanum dulcamara]
MGQLYLTSKSICLLLYFQYSIIVMSIAISGLESTDQLALQELKNRITEDPLHVMASWNHHSSHFCNWTGVTCSPYNGRVTNLDLSSRQLAGTIPPSIGNLSFLTGIDLANNNFRGEIPQAIGRLLHLQHLNVSYNSCSGKIPTNLTYCKELRALDLQFNELVGKIVDQLSSLSKLYLFKLKRNSLGGGIPRWLGNFSSLEFLDISGNSLQGPIPEDLGRLTKLLVFHVNSNELSGTIPPSILNISSIYYFSVTQNLLHGQLPADVGLTLPNVEVFAGAVNSFTGPIPVSLGNASKLHVIDFSQNKLTGDVPTSFGKLETLVRLNFEANRLGGRGSYEGLKFLDYLTNCTNLMVLSFATNDFRGELPYSITNLSTVLEIFSLGNNRIHGTLPAGIGNLISLTLLGMEGNYLNGSVPEAIGKLEYLERLYLNGNAFSGKIPFSIGNLTRLGTLNLEENRLEGSIPPELGKCKILSTLNLTRNNLIGSIPKEFAGLSSLSISLSLGSNSLTGSLPKEFDQLINLEELDLSQNKLSGEIPSSLSNCLHLERLNISNNLFQGIIPQSLANLKGLAEIDFSRNNLSGKIPEFLGKLSYLRKLDLSFNELEGGVPKEGIFSNTSAISIKGNSKLCGGVPNLHLPECPKAPKDLNSRVWIAVIVPVALLALVLCFCGAYYRLRNSRKSHPWIDGQLAQIPRTTYREIRRATDGFSEDNLVGTGSFGSVYKAHFHGEDTIMAVKVLNLQQRGALRSFLDECRALRNIRHRNLLKIKTACSSIDHQGNDFKCLVFEFMTNGNLHDWLHSENDDQQHQTKKLTFIQRLNIAIDVASALDYLHNHCQTPIVHCDLKPSNILLDEEMSAHVGDFGLATFLLDTSSNSWSHHISAALKGSIGYIPTEYGSGGQVSTLGDVYSFGIVLLELFICKRPTDAIFNESINIHKYVSMSLPEHVMEIVDPSLLLAEEEQNINQDQARRVEECLLSVLEIGLRCSASSPRDRAPIDTILSMLQAIQESFLTRR